MGDGGERGYEKVLEASGAPVHVWVRAGLSVHRASRQAILYLNGCPAQRPVSSHGHCRLWLPPQACGVGAYGQGLRGGRREKTTKAGEACQCQSGQMEQVGLGAWAFVLRGPVTATNHPSD